MEDEMAPVIKTLEKAMIEIQTNVQKSQGETLRLNMYAKMQQSNLESYKCQVFLGVRGEGLGVGC